MPTVIMAVKNQPSSQPCRMAPGPGSTTFRVPRRTKLAPLSSSSTATSSSSSAATHRSSSQSINYGKTELVKLKHKPHSLGPSVGKNLSGLNLPNKSTVTTNQTRRNTTIVGGGGGTSITIPPKPADLRTNKPPPLKNVTKPFTRISTLRLTTSEPPKLRRNTLDPALKQDLYLMLQTPLSNLQLSPEKSESTLSITTQVPNIPELVLLKPEPLEKIFKPSIISQTTLESDSKPIVAIAEPSPLKPELLRSMFVHPEIPEIVEPSTSKVPELDRNVTTPNSSLYVTVATAASNKPKLKPLVEEEDFGAIIGKFLESTNTPEVIDSKESKEDYFQKDSADSKKDSSQKDSKESSETGPGPPSSSGSTNKSTTSATSSQHHHNYYHYHQYHYYCCSNRKCLRKLAKSSSKSRSSQSHQISTGPELENNPNDGPPQQPQYHCHYRRHRKMNGHQRHGTDGHRKSSILSLGHSEIEYPLSSSTGSTFNLKNIQSQPSTADSSFSSAGPTTFRRTKRLNSASMQVLLATSSFDMANNTTTTGTGTNSNIRLPQLVERKKVKHGLGRHRQHRPKPELPLAKSASTTVARSSISYIQNKFEIICRRLSDVTIGVSNRRRSVQTAPCLDAKSKSKITTRSLPTIYPLKSSKSSSSESSRKIDKTNSECQKSTKSLVDSPSNCPSKTNSKIRFSINESVEVDQFSLRRSSSTSSVHFSVKQMPLASAKTSFQSKSSSIVSDENCFESLLRHKSFLQQIDPLPSRHSAANANKFTSSTFSLLTSMSNSGQASTAVAGGGVGMANTSSPNRLIQEIKDHKTGVNCLELSEDRSLLVSGGEDAVVRLWSTFSTPCECIGILTGHRSYITCCAVYRHLVISGSADKTLKVWTIQEGNCIRTLRGHSAFVNRCYCYGPLLLSTSFDCTVRVWPLTDQLTIVRYINSSYHNEDYSDDNYSDDQTEQESGQNGELSNSGSTKNDDYRSRQRRKSFTNSDIITRQNVNTTFGSCLHILKGHTKSITQVAVVTNDEYEIENGIIQELNTIAVTVSTDGTGRTWNLATGEIRHVLLGHNGPINCLAIDPKERQFVYTAGSDSVIKCWDIITGEHLRDLTGHQDAVLSLVAHNRILYSGCSDSTARAWAMEFGQCTRIFYKSAGPITAIQIFNGILYTGSNDNSTRLYDSNSAVLLQTFTAHTNSISALKIVPGKLFTASFDGRILVWDCADLQNEIESGETPVVRDSQLNSRLSLNQGSKWTNKRSMSNAAKCCKKELPVTGKLAMLHRKMLIESSKRSSTDQQRSDAEISSLYCHQSTETDQDRTIQSLIKLTVPEHSKDTATTTTRNSRSKKSSSKTGGSNNSGQLSKLWSVSKNLFAVRSTSDSTANNKTMADYSTGLGEIYEEFVAQEDSANVRRAIDALEPYIRSFR